jgi:glycerol-3-phosphate acyltransferase PlsY
MVIAAPIIMAYLLGSIPFGFLVSRVFGVGDIRRHGSGNIGATNVWRVVGRRAAAWTYVGDIGKGAAAVLLARYWSGAFDVTPDIIDPLLVATALAAVTGHMFPVYLRFRGGKGVSTALGGVMVLLPLESLAGLLVFVLVVAFSRYISLGSMAGAVSLGVVVVTEKYLLQRDIAVIYVGLAAVLAVLIVLTHRHNIGRLLSGTENKFSLSSGSGKDQSDV